VRKGAAALDVTIVDGLFFGITAQHLATAGPGPRPAITTLTGGPGYRF
jgi:hypothetical protein